MHSQAGSSLQRTCRLIGCKLFSSQSFLPFTTQSNARGSKKSLRITTTISMRATQTAIGSNDDYKEEDHLDWLAGFLFKKADWRCWVLPILPRVTGQGRESYNRWRGAGFKKNLKCAIRLHVWLMKAGVVYIWSDHMLLVKIIRVFSIFSTFHCP